MKKKLLSLTAVLLLFITLAFSASAVTIKEFNSKSTFAPVNYSSHKAVSEVTLYGNADYLCMKAYSETKNKEYFCIEIYSDSKRTKQILSYSNTFKKGTTYENVLFDLTSLKSKTYYATSYVMKESQYFHVGDNLKKDPATEKNFKIIVKKEGTSIKNMKCIMYGYENTFYGPAIYWYSVPGATKYYVYKYTDSKYKKIATVDATDEEFSFYVDETLKSKNATRYYKVKAVKGSSATALSEKLKVGTLKSPVVKAEIKPNGIRVTWSKPKNGCSYIVFRAVNDGDWESVVSTGDTSYNDTNVKSGNAYYYTVVAQSGAAVSGYDPYGAGCYYMKAPSITKAAEEDEAMVITWKAVSKADNYQVYRKLYGDKEWTLIGQTSETTFVDGTAEKNTLYDYAVKAGKGGYYSEYGTRSIPVAIFDVPILNEIETNEKGNAIITWDGKDGVIYQVMRKEGDGNWVVIKQLNGSEYVDTDTVLSNGKKYSYTVKPVLSLRIEGDVDTYGEYIYGSYDNTGEEFLYYAPINSLTPLGTVSGVQLSWGEVSNIDGYNIYRKTAGNEYEFVGTSQKAIYEDKDILPGIRYTYKVAYCTDGEEKSALSAETEVELSSEPISFSDEPAVFNPRGQYWTFSLSEFSAENKYNVYIRSGESWKLINPEISEDGVFTVRNNEAKVTNEYAVAATKTDGTITPLPEKGKVLSPVNFSVTLKIDQEAYAADISWSAVEGAEKYNIYSNQYEFITSVEGTEGSCRVMGLAPSSYYTYFVGAVFNGTEVFRVSNNAYLYETPEITVTTSAQGVNIEWAEPEIGCDFAVYRKSTPEEEWERVELTRSYVGWTDESVEDGKTYYYCVLKGDRNTGAFSAFPEKAVKVTYIKPTKVSKVTFYKDYLKFSWDESSVADCYQIYRKEGSGSWKLVYTTDDGEETTYTDKKVKAGTKYTYSVRVVKDGERSEGAKKTVTFLAAPKNVKVKVSNTVPVISFEKSKGATKYYIYRKVGSGSWKKIATTSNLSYSDFDVGKGKISYRVKAYNGGNVSVASSTVTINK